MNEQLQLLRREALAGAEGVRAHDTVYGGVKAALHDMRYHDIPNGVCIVGYCDRVAQALR